MDPYKDTRVVGRFASARRSQVSGGLENAHWSSVLYQSRKSGQQHDAIRVVIKKIQNETHVGHQADGEFYPDFGDAEENTKTTKCSRNYLKSVLKKRSTTCLGCKKFRTEGPESTEQPGNSSPEPEGIGRADAN